MNPNAGEPVNPGGAAASSNPLANLEGVVAATQQEAAAQTATAPVEAPPETPHRQFENQFGSGPDTQPVVNNAAVPGLIDTALANLETPAPAADASTPPEPTQPAETLAQPEPEQTPAEKWQRISDNVKAFLEEVTQKQGVTS